MKKPCDTEKFIKILCDEFADEFTYDDYRIPEAVISWNKGEYIDAVKDFSLNAIEDVFGEGLIVKELYHTWYNNEGPQTGRLIGYEIVYYEGMFE